MSLGRALCVGLVGLNGYLVEVEADIGQTLPAFVLLGLPDASLSEARDRIRAAAKNAGIPLSRRKITVNLVPASLPKKGSGFDLAIVMSALSAAGDVRGTGATVFLAELGLDGRLRPVRGVLPSVMAAVAGGCRDIVVAEENAPEARLVPQARVRGFGTLAEVALCFGADAASVRLPPDSAGDDDEPGNQRPGEGAAGEERPLSAPGTARQPPDMSDIVGQAQARFALEIAAAGGHHLLLSGPPGAGKTMLAERLPGLLPDLGDEHAMETTAIHSLSGGPGLRSLIRRPPYESPHHTASPAAIIGGGTGVPRPGAASRAHRGVLFLDEAPEFDRRVLDSLRQPLESGQLTLHRAAGTAAYPARFQLVLAANPCPCGLSAGKGLECTCTAQQRRRYFGRISGPLLDRLDLQIAVPRISLTDLRGGSGTEGSAAIAARVAAARIRQRQRLGGQGLFTNAEMSGRLLRGQYRLPQTATASADRALERQVLTARGYDRVLRVAWTINDLRGGAAPAADDVAAALQLRQSEAVPV